MSACEVLALVIVSINSASVTRLVRRSGTTARRIALFVSGCRTLRSSVIRQKCIGWEVAAQPI